MTNPPELLKAVCNIYSNGCISYYVNSAWHSQTLSRWLSIFLLSHLLR